MKEFQVKCGIKVKWELIRRILLSFAMKSFNEWMMLHEDFNHQLNNWWLIKIRGLPLNQKSKDVSFGIRIRLLRASIISCGGWWQWSQRLTMEMKLLVNKWCCGGMTTIDQLVQLSDWGNQWDLPLVREVQADNGIVEKILGDMSIIRRRFVTKRKIWR